MLDAELVDAEAEESRLAAQAEALERAKEDTKTAAAKFQMETQERDIILTAKTKAAEEARVAAEAKAKAEEEARIEAKATTEEASLISAEAEAKMKTGEEALEAAKAEAKKMPQKR